MFKNREDAALLLVKELRKIKDSNGIVLAIPRGGVPVGYIIAKELHLPLELILSKKIGHPDNPEYAIGSVSLLGTIIDKEVQGVSPEYIKSEVARLHKVLKEKFNLFVGKHKPTDLKDKTVILVDDGIATGYTIRATIEVIKRYNPKEIIIAVPVAPTDTARKLTELVDEFICLIVSDNFRSIGQFYEDFSQVEDQEVICLLRESNKF